MFDFSQIKTPTECDVVAGFFDLARFIRTFNSMSPSESFAFMDAYYRLVGDILEQDGGMVIKFMGDAGLVLYPAEQASAAVRRLLALSREGDAWLRQRKIDSYHVIKANVGPAMVGPIGTRREQRLDVFGETVNLAAKMSATGFAITPELFRRLDAETRKLFKKHTPPISYIPQDEPHTAR